MHASLRHLLLTTALQEYDPEMSVGELISMLKEEIAATGKELAGEIALKYYINSVSKEHNTDSDLKTGIGAMKKALVLEKRTRKKGEKIAKKKMLVEKKRLEMAAAKESQKMLKLATERAIKVANNAAKEADKCQKLAEKEVVKVQKKVDKEEILTKHELKKQLKKKKDELNDKMRGLDDDQALMEEAMRERKDKKKKAKKEKQEEEEEGEKESKKIKFDQLQVKGNAGKGNEIYQQ